MNESLRFWKGLTVGLIFGGFLWWLIFFFAISAGSALGVW